MLEKNAAQIDPLPDPSDEGKKYDLVMASDSNIHKFMRKYISRLSKRSEA